MDLISSFTKSDDKTASGDPKISDHRLRPSKSDLIHSARVVADAARAHVRREPDKYEKTEVAGATADLINAAAECAELDDNKGVGKYVDKAEDYLRRYQTSHSADQEGEASRPQTN